jgi:hypothetical protein
LAGDLFEIADVLGNALDEGELFEAFLVNDVVNHEDVGGREIGVQCCGDVLARGANDPHATTADAFNLIDEEDVRRFADGDSEDVVDPV